MENEEIEEWLDEEIEVTFSRSVGYSVTMERRALARKFGVKLSGVKRALREEDDFSGWDSGEKDMAEVLESYAKPSNDSGDGGAVDEIEIDGTSF